MKSLTSDRRRCSVPRAVEAPLLLLSLGRLELPPAVVVFLKSGRVFMLSKECLQLHFDVLSGKALLA
ncbi:MAG TPA: hypothetical protein VD840_14800, partial [Sinorhizobium sp.]|nr:hypothetical protein [Sinorhizobium sp.]